MQRAHGTAGSSHANPEPKTLARAWPLGSSNSLLCALDHRCLTLGLISLTPLYAGAPPTIRLLLCCVAVLYSKEACEGGVSEATSS